MNTQCKHPIIDTRTNACAVCGMPYLPRIDTRKRLITAAMLEDARNDSSKPQSWRQAIIDDYHTETKALDTLCSDGRTVKDTVDHLVFNLHCTNWAWSGNTLVVTNADKEARYQLHRDYAPYLRVAIRARQRMTA